MRSTYYSRLQDAEAAADEYESESEPEEAEDDSADDKEVQPASKKRGRPKKAEADIDEEDMEAPKNLIPAPKDGAVFERTPPRTEEKANNKETLVRL